MFSDKKLYKKQFFIFQGSLIIMGTLVCLFWGDLYSFSFLLGSLLMFVANIIFLLRIFLNKNFYSPIKEIFILYICEFIKLLMILIGTIYIIASYNIKISSYIAGILTLQFTTWFLPAFVKLKNGKKIKEK